MSQAKQWSMQTTLPEQGDADAGGSTVLQNVNLRQGTAVQDYSKEKAEHRQGREDESLLEAPTPMEDGSPYCDEKASVGVQRFHQKYWDRSQATAGPPQGTAQVNQPVSTSIAMPTSGVEDPVMCVDPQACLPRASTSHADDREMGKTSSRSPWTTDTDPCADIDVSKDTLNTEESMEVVEEGKRSSAENTEENMEVEEKENTEESMEVEEEENTEESMEVEEEENTEESMEVEEEENTAESMEVEEGKRSLAEECEAESSPTAPVKSPALGGKGKAVGKGRGQRKSIKSALGGKGKAVGKGRGQRKSVKVGFKAEKGREAVRKVMSSCAITKAKTREKKILHRKKLPLVLLQLKQAVPASSHPKPSYRRMVGVPKTGANPQPCTRFGSASVSVVEEKNSVLVPPPNTFSAVSSELGQARKPPFMSDQLSDPWDLHGCGNESLAPAGVASQPQQLVKAVHAVSSQTVSACSVPTSLNAAVGRPPFVSNGELKPQVMDQVADPDHFQVLLHDNQRVQEQIAPEGWQAGFTSPINDTFMADMNEGIPMDDIADGGFPIGEFVTSVNQDVQGNLPNFD